MAFALFLINLAFLERVAITFLRDDQRVRGTPRQAKTLGKYALDARTVCDKSRQSKCIACQQHGGQVKNQHLRNRALLAHIIPNSV